MRSKEELNTQKEGGDTESKKIHELTEKELAQISGGGPSVRVKGDDIARLNTTEAAAALQSKAAGVNIIPSQGQPGASAGIKLR